MESMRKHRQIGFNVSSGRHADQLKGSRLTKEGKRSLVKMLVGGVRAKKQNDAACEVLKRRISISTYPCPGSWEWGSSKVDGRGARGRRREG